MTNMRSPPTQSQTYMRSRRVSPGPTGRLCQGSPGISGEPIRGQDLIDRLRKYVLDLLADSVEYPGTVLADCPRTA
jgi:hypothetical protein